MSPSHSAAIRGERLVCVLLGKLGELVPISNLVTRAMGAIRLSLIVSGFSPPLPPQINCVAANLKYLSDFAFFPAI